MSGILQINLETVEPRVRYERQAQTLDGRAWDLYFSSNVGVDFITKTGFLLPVPLAPEWQTTTTGAYKRLTKADYALTTPTQWVDFDRNGLSGNTYLQSLNINEKVYTPALLKDQPVYLSWYAYNAGNSRFKQLQCGWGEGTSAQVDLYVWSDNSVEVYRNGTYVATGNLADGAEYPSDFGDRRGADAGRGTQNANRVVDMLLIPTRGAEILILSQTEGGGFNVLFEDIDLTEPDDITGAGAFYWYVPQGKATVQCQAPMQSRTDGTIYTLPVSLRYPPQSGSSPDITTYFNLSGYGSASYTASVTDENGAAFTADGTADTIRLKYVLSGDGTASPFIYAGVVVFAGSAENTAGETYDVTALTRESGGAVIPELNVGESPSDVTFTFTLKNPAEVEGSLSLIKTVGNRPFEANILGTEGTVAIITGRTLDPKFEYGISDEVSRIVFECRDRWEAFDQYIIADPEPLDGVNLGTAFRYFATLPGYADSEVSIETIDFTFPVITGASQGEWGVIPQAGDTAGQWLTQLYEDYARNMWVGWRPGTAGPIFAVWGTATLGTAPQGTLFGTFGSAGGTPQNVYRSFRQTTLRPEANDIYARGQNKRTKLPIWAHYTDLESVNPTLAEASRPDNWLGERRKYMLIAPEITTQEIANWAGGVLYGRLGQPRIMAEWRSDLLVTTSNVPLWRGDVVKIDGYGRYRINTISGSFQHEWGTVSPYRDLTYTGERIGD